MMWRVAAFCISFLLTPSVALFGTSPPPLPSRRPVHADECHALLQFKDSYKIANNNTPQYLCAESGFNFTSSPKTATWKEANNCCTWDGIVCDNITGNVIEVELTCSYLQGAFYSNSSLFLLRHLQRLYLGGNYLTGPIPYPICQQSSLRHLVLRDNELSGIILPCLGNLSNLNILDLSFNRLQGPLPRTLANCTSLNMLAVVNNEINDSFPLWLRSLHLYDLQLAANNFHGLMTSDHATFPFPYLRHFFVGPNHLHGQFPPEYFQSSNLTYINLSFNMFDGFPPIPPVTAQAYIVSGNKFTGEIPSSFCNVNTLFSIDMSNNSLIGNIPQCLINVNTGLQLLDLSRNRFQGPIPEILASNNCSLQIVVLSQNHLGGKLPRSWESCKPLGVLDLSDNEVEDSFPSWLETHPNLYILVLSSNKFYGPITTPKAIHPFPKLHIFDISNNNFSGNFPTQYLANFSDMMGGEREGIFKYLNRGWVFAFQAANVIYKRVEMKLEHIQKALFIIDLSRNHFQGEIPNVIGNLQLLTGLNLSHNNLGGVIPSSLGNLTHLEWLDLSSNNFTGEIPEALTNLTSLAIFNVSMNQLTGQIPQEKQFKTFEGDSFGGNPRLCGYPLPKLCTNGHLEEPPSAFQDDDDAEPWIEWRAMLMGYGFGTVIGLSIGYILIQKRRFPAWLIKLVE